MMELYLIDTSAVVAYVNEKHPQHTAVVRFVDNPINKTFALISPQILYEFYVVATRPQSERGGLGMAPLLAVENIELLVQDFDLRPDSVDMYQRWVDIISTYSVRGKLSHDARLAAWMNGYGINQVLTLNPKDFIRLGVLPLPI